jgi:phenylalanyl-tRNA synthetase beta chain
MKLPLPWLKEYIDPGIPAERLAEALTMSGSKVETVEKKLGEFVIDIEVTTNRPDCLSVLGLANEVAALSGRKVKIPECYRAISKNTPRKRSIDISIEDKKACPRYTGRILENTRVAASPAKVQKYLELMATRPISNVVDATNFVLFEIGQPLHAFDLDKLRGGKIIVRRSRKGEKFLGIDGIEYELDAETLVIADAEGPVAIAGVIGGKITEVTETTKNVFLESAFFDPAVVRQQSKKYKVTTESSYRFERSVNPKNVPLGSLRAAELIREWAGGEDKSGLLDKNYSSQSKGGRITLTLSRLKAVLGIDISQKRVLQILKGLSLDPRAVGTKGVSVPRTPMRKDLDIEEDLMEEVLRVEGFDKIPAALPLTRHEGKASEFRKSRLTDLKYFLCAKGFQEILTYSMLPGKRLTDCGLDTGNCVRILNPVSAEQEYLRPLLLPGMLESAVYNIHRKAASVWFFETGKTFLEDGREENKLGLLLYGANEENWKRKSSVSYFDLKGALENLAAFLGLGGLDWEEGKLRAYFEYGAQAVWDGRPIGFVGSVRPDILRAWDIPHETFYAEMSLEGVLHFAPPPPRVKPVPKFPSVRRDIAFVVEEGVSVRALEETMKKAAGPSLRETRLFDQYSGKNIPAGKKSLAFSLGYQKDTGTFTDEEIYQLQTRVGEALKNAFHAEFR